MAASDGDDVAANLSPAMLRSEMDAFLLTIGAKATPFSVSDMFAGAKHKDTWDEIVAVLQLVDAGAGGPCFMQGQVALDFRPGVPFFTPLPRGVSR